MKKLVLTVIAAVSMLFFADKASAQIEGVGVFGGFTSSSSNVKNFTPSSVSQYHLGVAYKFNLGLGLAIQPSVSYQVKGTTLDMIGSQTISENLRVLDASVGYVEIPLQIQWGPDLMAFRPYVLAEPFVGFGVNFKAAGPLNIETVKNDWKAANMSRLEYGIGLGGGIEVWRFQVAAKYFWNFGSLCDNEGKIDVGAVANTVSEAFKGGKNFNGISVSLGFFF
ncbi:MAG: outer membrane beta-barrel protein [Bacteroidales bacterium]|nr:outer membrane beta-barrel protein [Bacteroidales bacterium]